MYRKVLVLFIVLLCLTACNNLFQRTPQVCLEAEDMQEAGDNARAVKLYAQCINTGELDAEDLAIYYYNRGNAYYKLSNYEKAVSDYSHAIEFDPDVATTYNRRGVAHSKLGHHEQAILDYDRAIELNSYYASAYNNRGISYEEFGKYRHAIKDYNRALELNPDFSFAYNNRGNAYSDLGQYKQAIKDYTRAAELDPDDADTYFNRGLVYHRQGQHRQAIQDFDQAILLDPQHAMAFYNRSESYYKLGNDKHALKDFKRAFAISPKESSAFVEVLLLFHLESEKMIEEAEETASRKRNHKNLHALASVYAKEWLFEKAVKAEQEAIKMARESNVQDSIIKKYKVNLKHYKEKMTENRASGN